MKPPVAKKIPHQLSIHGHDRNDPWYWLKDRENPEVIDYLNKENEYCEYILEPVKGLREELYKEMKSRIKEDDSSAPYFKNGYWYYHRYNTGEEYPIYCRKEGTLDQPEEIMINENLEAEAHPYYEIVAFSISRDNKILAFSEDITGRRLYRTRFKNLETGEILPNVIENTGSDLAWMNDGKSILFNVKDIETLRPDRIFQHDLESGTNTLVYEEKDETYICTVSKTKDSRHILIGSHSTLTTEFRFRSADAEDEFKVFLERKNGHEYYPECGSEGFYIKSNLDALNFKIAYCNIDDRDPKNWTVIQEHSEEIYIEDFETFDKHLVVQEKLNGLTQLRVYDLEQQTSRLVPSMEETYTLYIDTNPEMQQRHLRIGYSSMTTPNSVFDIDLISFERTLIKQKEVLGDFKVDNYKSERIWAPSHDGVKVPVSLVYRTDKFKKDGSNPVLIYAYGSYGSTIDPYFSTVRLSLLDRGFVFAIAHIRGGEYLGRSWYEDGKLLKKKNTFLDFIAAADHLIKERYADSKKVYAMGGSAGGLLMGAIANLRPELWRGIVSNVPFVDVITTMLDDSIPLTTGEYDEWGNPNEEKYYRYMLSYSPYDQLESKAYPAMLITSGLHDSQVQYWEPTKYVAKLRDLKTDEHPVLLHTNMEAGHGGASGRFEQLKEIAMEYAFIFFLNG